MDKLGHATSMMKLGFHSIYLAHEQLAIVEFSRWAGMYGFLDIGEGKFQCLELDSSHHRQAVQDTGGWPGYCILDGLQVTHAGPPARSLLQYCRWEMMIRLELDPPIMGEERLHPTDVLPAHLCRINLRDSSGDNEWRYQSHPICYLNLD